jgi:hypothetical protein
MQHFFAIIRTELTRDIAVTLITLGDILSSVENEFNAHTRALCEMKKSPVEKAREASRYLRQKWPLVEFFPYQVIGARSFLDEAMKIDKRTALHAVVLVEDMRDKLNGAINQTLNGVRSALIQDLTKPENWTDDTEFVKDAAQVAAAGTAELIGLI